MAHLLDVSLGRAAFAFAGQRSDIWHGLGQEIDAARATDIDYLIEHAALGWSAVHVPLRYTFAGAEHVAEDLCGIVRDDTAALLGAGTPDRKEVQPRDVVTFFRDFLADNKLSISTLGAIRGGRVVWALAKLGPEFSFMLPGSDTIDCYVRLQTSYDGSRSTSLVPTTVRQVCANTERMVESATQGKQYVTRHTSVFRAAPLQAAIGLLGEAQRVTAEVYNKLAQREVTDAEVNEYFCALLGIDWAELTKADSKIHGRTRNKFAALYAAYKHGPGSDLASANGTAFGLLNAATFYVDHQASVRDTRGDGAAKARAASAWFGTGAAVKDKARELAVALAA
jgi:phage/plasmid-like protein (TIGR03299 family)